MIDRVGLEVFRKTKFAEIVGGHFELVGGVDRQDRRGDEAKLWKIETLQENQGLCVGRFDQRKTSRALESGQTQWELQNGAFLEVHGAKPSRKDLRHP